MFGFGKFGSPKNTTNVFDLNDAVQSARRKTQASLFFSVFLSQKSPSLPLLQNPVLKELLQKGTKSHECPRPIRALRRPRGYQKVISQTLLLSLFTPIFSVSDISPPSLGSHTRETRRSLMRRRLPLKEKNIPLETSCACMTLFKNFILLLEIYVSGVSNGVFC